MCKRSPAKETQAPRILPWHTAFRFLYFYIPSAAFVYITILTLLTKTSYWKRTWNGKSRALDWWNRQEVTALLTHLRLRCQICCHKVWGKKPNTLIRLALPPVRVTAIESRHFSLIIAKKTKLFSRIHNHSLNHCSVNSKAIKWVALLWSTASISQSCNLATKRAELTGIMRLTHAKIAKQHRHFPQAIFVENVHFES